MRKRGLDLGRNLVRWFLELRRIDDGSQGSRLGSRSMTMGIRDLHRRTIPAPTPRERERWQAIWLLAQGWTASATAGVLERDPDTIRPVGHSLWRGRACGIDVRAVRGVPPALGKEEPAELRAAVQELPAAVAVGLVNWNWKVVGQFVWEHFGINLSRSSGLNYPCLHEDRFHTVWDSS